MTDCLYLLLLGTVILHLSGNRTSSMQGKPHSVILRLCELIQTSAHNTRMKLGRHATRRERGNL